MLNNQAQGQQKGYFWIYLQAKHAKYHFNEAHNPQAQGQKKLV